MKWRAAAGWVRESEGSAPKARQNCANASASGTKSDSCRTADSLICPESIARSLKAEPPPDRADRRRLGHEIGLLPSEAIQALASFVFRGFDLDPIVVTGDRQETSDTVGLPAGSLADLGEGWRPWRVRSSPGSWRPCSRCAACGVHRGDTPIGGHRFQTAEPTDLELSQR